MATTRLRKMNLETSKADTLAILIITNYRQYIMIMFLLITFYYYTLVKSHHRGPAQSVCVTVCNFIVNVWDLT